MWRRLGCCSGKHLNCDHSLTGSFRFTVGFVDAAMKVDVSMNICSRKTLLQARIESRPSQ